MCNLLVYCVGKVIFHREYWIPKRISDLNQIKKKKKEKTSLRRHILLPFLASMGMCHHNCFHGNRIMRITQHAEKERIMTRDWIRRWEVENECMWERIWEQILHKKQAEDKEWAKAAHFHACWLFWLPSPCLLLSPFSVLCLLPPGSGQKRAWALVWALKSFGYQPSVALYLQPSVKGPPAATHRSTSLPWPRGAIARSGDGAGSGT